MTGSERAAPDAARNAIYYAAHRGERRAYNATYYAAHREVLLARQARHSEERAVYQVAYRSAHPDERREHGRLASAKRRGATTCDHPACLIVGATQLAWQTNEHVCYLCGTQLWQGVNLHMDHVYPISLGGVHCADNLRPACAPCNWSKHTKVLP